MTNCNQKYFFYTETYSKQKVFLIQSIDGQEKVWFKYGTLKRIVSKYKFEVLEAVHQNISSNLKKEQIIQQLIQEAKKHVFSPYWSQTFKRIQKRILKKNLFNHLNELFKYFLIQIITPKLWKHGFHLVKVPQLLQIIEHTNIKCQKNCIQTYLIKYKYFDDPQLFFSLKKSALIRSNHSKALRQKFTSNTSISFREISCKNKNQQKKNQLPQIINNYKKYKIFGKASIRGYNFYLFNNSKELIQAADWYMNYIIIINQFYIIQINKKIQNSKHNIKNGPYFDRQVIKKQILKQMLQKVSEKSQCDQHEKSLSELRLEKVVEQKIKIFMIKYKQIKQQVQNYLDQTIPMFNSLQDNVNIDIIRSQINQIYSKSKKAKQQYEFFSTQKNKLKQKKQSLIKKQFQYDNDTESENEIENAQNQQDFGQQTDLIKDQDSQEQQEVQFIKQEDQSIDSNISQFFQKVKQQCKQQQMQEFSYEYNKQKKIKKSLQSKVQNYKSKMQKKKLKKQRKIRDSIIFQNSQRKVKKQEVSTSIQLSKQEVINQTQEQSLKVKNQEQSKVIQIFRIKHVLSEDFLYLVKFENGKFMYGTQSEVMQVKGVNQNIIKKAKDIFPINEKIKKFT